MIHALQYENPQIAQVARQEISDDLPSAVLQRLVAAGKSIQQQLDSTGAIALGNHVLAGADLPHILAALLDRGGFLLRQRSKIRKLAEQWVVHGLMTHRRPKATAPSAATLASQMAAIQRSRLMVAIVRNFAAKHPVRPRGIPKDRRHEHAGTHQHEYLAALRRGRIPNR